LDWGILFFGLIGGLIISILANVVVYARGRRKRKPEVPSRSRVLGRILAVVGGFIAPIAIILPWAIDRHTPPPPITIDLGGVDFVGAYGPITAYGFGPLNVLATYGIPIYGFGLFWLTWFAIPRKVAAILGVVWGTLALWIWIGALAVIADYAVSVAPNGEQVTFAYGFYLNVLGSALLIIGSALGILSPPIASIINKWLGGAPQEMIADESEGLGSGENRC
jgi:hypothetical protein